MSQKALKLTATILVVEDDCDLREALVDTLEIAGCSVVQADCAEKALALIPQHALDMVVSDINMGAMDGLTLLKEIRQHYPQLPVLLVTAYGSISASVEAIRNGAVDYLVKPFKPQLLVETVGRYVGIASVSEEDQPVAVEPSSLQLLQLAKRVAETDSTVLICGESGTGKEVLARYVHQQSPRAQQPFVAINCAAIPENMLEGMLFGHEKGAFTGAYTSAPGKFEQANGGTLLLDEISEMDVGLQAKILRVIQEREVERLGGRKTIDLDVRIVATTNRNLAEEVRAGRFREDLFYRLSVFPLQWLPLRERLQDIVPLAQKLLQMHTKKMGRPPVDIDASAVMAIRAHNWPGNVRELDNVIQRALIMQPGTVISDFHLRLDPFATTAMNIAPASAPASITNEQPAESMPGNTGNVLEGDLQRREFEIIVDTLRNEGGSRKNTAEKLGISARTLRYKIARMRDIGINVEAVLQNA
ncbi:sigma-54 dependent transcriptional regulator [Oceanicoccus sp. KOV_DT_Chl]|uniref:sigma-54-dependent transcriptional regulator n=1 Tax=Oceanicoccus sp. KOV_DT_Chl TaxID=1904639 RepID=UPI000C7AFB66|nr:sigma-54 dependent transcriptional regulator [Oceanicoccus sp. KOV_DT_Chl]